MPQAAERRHSDPVPERPVPLPKPVISARAGEIGQEIAKIRRNRLEEIRDEIAVAKAEHPALKRYAAPTAFRCEITPAVAHVLLSNTPKERNRPKRRSLISKYSKTLMDGRWVINGETVKLDTKSVCLDGQHRLEAVFETGIPLTTFVVAGLPPEAFKTIDTGAKRTPSVTLAMAGYSHAAIMAATARHLYANQHGLLGAKTLGGLRPEADQLDEVIAATPGLHESCVFATRAIRAAAVSALATSYHLMRQIDPVQAERFIDVLADKRAAASLQDPFHWLRDHLRLHRNRLQNHDIFFLCFSAWNMVRLAARCGQRDIRLPKPGEKIPELV